MPPREQSYPEEYIEAAFYAWYRAGAPSIKGVNNTITAGGRKFVMGLPPSVGGNRPHPVTVELWISRYGWRERVDALNAQVSLQIDRKVIKEREETLRKLSEAGKSIMEKGLDFFNKHPDAFVDNVSAAVRAIVSGAEMQFKYAGAADRLAAINQMSDKQIETEISKMLGTTPNEDENIIDSTLEDVPEDDDTTEDDNAGG